MIRSMSLALALTFTLAAVGCAEPGDGSSTDPTFIPGADGTTGADGGADVTGLPDTAPVGDAVTSPDSVVPQPDGVTPQPDGVTPQPDAVVTPDEGPTPNGGTVDPNCIDGQYSEQLPNINADLSGLLATYPGGSEKQFASDVLGVRWPVGQYIYDGGLATGASFGSQDCFDAFRGSQGGVSGLMSRMSTLVHECGHFYDIDEGGFSGSAYQITPQLSLTCPSGGGPPPWGDGSTPPRSALLNDQWESLHPSCDTFGQSGCNSYGNVYLKGQGGDQGFNTVLEETLQYVNSLGTDYALVDQGSQFGATSARDGILTFLWFVQRYLYLARTEYPSAYTLLTNSCWRNAILTIWGRAWLYIDATEGFSQLGIEDDMLMEFVLDPVLLNEIQLLRNAAGCN